MRKKTLKIQTTDPTDFQLVVNAAVRYSLGRETYIVPAITQFVIDNLDNLSISTISCILRDINQMQCSSSGLGLSYDIEQCWNRLYEKLKLHLQDLGEEN